MRVEKLPKGSYPQALKIDHFPSSQQAVIWRNWELVPVKTLASLLKTGEQEILKLAEDMGLSVPPEVDNCWLEKSYLTIIRNNWHLLPYEQILEVLGWTPEYMAHILKEEDFLWHKLGRLKPAVAPVCYKPLSELEIEKTAALKKALQKNFPNIPRTRVEKPFSFMEKYEKKINTGAQAGNFDFNFIYPYSSPCGDFLLHRELDPLPENLLSKYSSMGIKGIWLPVVLYTLYPIAGAEKFSKGYTTRLKNLQELVKKAKKYGIDLYLYLNEPRCMPSEFYEKHPKWKGIESADEGIFHNCITKNNAALEWLEKACFYVFKNIPDLAGAFSILMSENPTHCHSHWRGEECAHCKNHSTPEIIAKIIKTIENGIHRASPKAKVMVWNWGWDRKWEHDVLDLMPEKVYLICTSENWKQINIAGTKGIIGEYSISHTGPSSRSMGLWKHAQELGIKTVAKVQLNNSWELSAVPYIPVPYLIKEHLDKLLKNDIDGIMLSWTLGGYPGGNLELVASSPEKIALRRFGKDIASFVCKAWGKFSDAFREFPFHIKVLYFSPTNYGPKNLLYSKRTGFKASMIGFPYDDLDSWRGIYSENILEQQFKKLTEGWKEGLEILKSVEWKIEPEIFDEFTDLKNVAIAAYCHLRSTYLQIRFIRLRDKALQEEILSILNEEIELAKVLHDIVMKDSRIGFEASNHYFYTLNDLKEKVLNCEYLKSIYKINTNLKSLTAKNGF